MTFRKGDKVVFYPKKEGDHAAQPGSTAIVTRDWDFQHIYLEVKWVKCIYENNTGPQSDGGYYTEDFKLLDKGIVIELE